jgi:molybdopterin/thiamine biosynthesis adenylyltransferase
VIGALAGVIGCLQALEAVKYLARAGKSLTGVLLTFDALTMEFRRVKIPARIDCAVCGPDATITEAVNCVTAPVCRGINI